MRYFLALLLIPVVVQADLLDDLMVVDYWNQKINDPFPYTTNNLLYGGLINMPSARMDEAGVLGAGFSYVHPYHNYNIRCQLTERIEVSGNYRIFRGVDDPILTPMGFGDMSDKGANVKIAIFLPEDTNYELPGFAFGFEDFMGTRNFKGEYVVLTQVLRDWNLELTLGYGMDRIRGFFGGTIWFPFRRSGCWWIDGLAFVAEYDATPYDDVLVEKHPQGRRSKSPINVGVKYRLFDAFDFSASYVRGHEWAVTASTYYNFGDTEGFLPKINDPLPYRAPLNHQPIGWLRTYDTLTQDLVYNFREQGFEILGIWIEDCRHLTIEIYNFLFDDVCEVRSRFNALLAGIIPSDIDCVTFVMDAEGFPIHQFEYSMEQVRDFANGNVCEYELNIMTSMTEVSALDPFDIPLYRSSREWFDLILTPKTDAYFGSSKGKFKYALGLNFGGEGYLWDDYYYHVLFGYTCLNNLRDISDVDRLNPSQLISVRTDVLRYLQATGLTLDEAYIQRNWNLGNSWFVKIAAGYFEVEYAGVALEFLHYPVNSCWAYGIDGAIFKKRAYRGLGFTDHVRKLHGFVPHWVNFPFGTQYFFNLYYDWQAAQLDLRVKAGKFLANDWGVRYEVSRYFPSGLRISLWYTATNGHDKINGHTYHDKGASFSMPLDIFYMNSSRETWSYGMSAWLRDVGVQAANGQDLYNMIYSQRQ